jgi:hypothetical protein
MARLTVARKIAAIVSGRLRPHSFSLPPIVSERSSPSRAATPQPETRFAEGCWPDASGSLPTTPGGPPGATAANRLNATMGLQWSGAANPRQRGIPLGWRSTPIRVAPLIAFLQTRYRFRTIFDGVKDSFCSPAFGEQFSLSNLQAI